MRVVDKEGNPGYLELYEQIVRINLIGSFNVLQSGRRPHGGARADRR